VSSLHPDLRKKLRDVVLEARRVAEKGAEQALRALSVEAAEPAASLTVEKRKLRVALRARGRQLGDALGRDNRQKLEHLTAECAYEHWHRMLFARFLAENHLLLHPEGVPVTLDEVRELADEEKPRVHMWELAARYATRMLPALFRPDDPVLALDLAAEHRTKLESLLAGLATEVFTADDGLGWVYQFWQEERKDAVNRSEVKIGADELPAVTQLFTEPYMVKFLLHNTLGAWWIGRHGGDPPVEMEFLRRNDDGTPAAGTFDEWPKRAAEIRFLDPCCGSGHFLVEGLKILVAFRVKEEGLAAGEAVDAVLRDNLFGLEIDPRCTQIAAFAVALTAWKLAGGYRELPADGVHVACCGIAPRAKKEEWLRLANGDEKLRNGLERLYELFKDAPTLGSLIDPTREEEGLFVAGWGELKPLMAKALAGERKDEEARELGVAARGIATAAEILAGRYTLVATNVPYLTRGKHDRTLARFCEELFPDAKADLATVFLERCLCAGGSKGTVGIVTPQNWLSLTTYGRLRARLLRQVRFDMVARLGEGGFQSSAAAGAFIALVVLSTSFPESGHSLVTLDAAEPRSPAEKAVAVAASPLSFRLQSKQLANPEARLMLGDGEGNAEATLGSRARASHGQGTFDSSRFVRELVELPTISKGWIRQQTPPEEPGLFGGASLLLRWEDGKGELAEFMAAWESAGYSSGKWKAGVSEWGKPGVLVGLMRGLPAVLYLGGAFDANAAAIVPENPDDTAAILAYSHSKEFHDAVRRLNQSIYVPPHTFLHVPFDVGRWRTVARKQYPNGLPAPYSEDPTQWIFKGTITPSTSPLHVAVARLLGYRWPDQEKDGLESLCDRDGIVCIPPVGGEQPAADRLRALLAAAYGKKWKGTTEAELLASVGYAGKSLDEWLRDGFFEQHSKLFHHRPFIWHIWDGRKKDGFHALVNYHKLDRKLLEKLTFTTLGGWIQQLRQAEKRGEGTAEARLAAALGLQERLEAILEGEDPYDIFVRWKPKEEQPIGWEPDLNDGVRLNIRPFVEADVLRKKPNIKWEKDRGKNPPGAPWGEERLNDLHLSLDEKGAARKKKGRA